MSAPTSNDGFNVLAEPSRAREGGRTGPRGDVSENDEMNGRDLIESTMDRVPREAPEAASVDAQGHPRLGRRAFDREVLRQLEQLASASVTQDPEVAAPPRVATQPLAALNGRTYGPGALVLVACLSAVLAAGSTWLAIGDTNRGSAADVAPPTVVAPPDPGQRAQQTPTTASVPTLAAPREDGDESRARDRVERWRKAWAERDVEAYLGSYSPDFRPADGQTRNAWAAARRKKLSSQTDISVQLHDIRLERIDDGQIKAIFLQDYASGSYREDARPKILLLTRAGGDWRIAGELQGTPAVGRR